MRTYFNDARDWFMNARFGLFVHWGIYAVPAWHEQHQFRLGVSRREYGEFAKEFNPASFDPNAWLDLMQEAGMQYLCFTTKHIDGKNAETRIEMLPWHHREGKPYLRIANLPVNENADTVLVVRLDFETLPGQIAASTRAETVA
jgi:hypothetical protein